MKRTYLYLWLGCLIGYPCVCENLTVPPPHHPSFVICGLTGEGIPPVAYPRTATYYNQVPTGRTSMAISERYDMERIEVMQGTQGAPFGRGSENGVIHFITHKPLPQWGESLSMQWGNYGMKEVEGAINMPVQKDKLLTRFAGIYSYQDGYVTNRSGGRLNGKNTLAGRSSVRYLPSPKLTIDWVVNYQKDDEPGTAFIGEWNGQPACDVTPDEENRFFNRRDVFGTSLHAEHRINAKHTIRSITSFYTNATASRWDSDSNTALLFDMTERVKANQLTHECRYFFTPNSRLSGLAGVSFWREDVSQTHTTPRIETNSDAINSACDAFADVTFRILPQLSLISGLRIAREAQALTNHNATETDTAKYSAALTCRLRLKYDLNPYTGLYAGYAKGHRPHVLQLTPAGNIEVVDAEKVHILDAGVQWNLPARYRLDLALFYHTYTCFQTPQWTNYACLIVDAGSATAYGAELTAKAVLMPCLDLFANYAYIHARFNEWDGQGHPQAYGGKSFRLTPTHSFLAGIHAKAKLSRALQLVFTPTCSWRSHVWFEDSNAKQPSGMTLPRLEQKAYGLLGASLTLQWRKPDTTLTLFVSNLTNEQFIISTNVLFDSPTYTPGAPRMFGAQLRLHF